MNARIAKETRVLLPVLGVTLALIILPFAFWGREGDFGVGAFIVGCVVLAAVSFGAEFQNRTLPMLLVQPVPRAALWLEKMLVLGGALLVSMFALAVSIALFARRDVTDVWPLVLVPLAAFCVTPGLTLGVRNTLGGIGASFCIPLFTIPPALWAFDHLFTSDHAKMVCGITLVLIFCAAVCRLGYGYFGDLQVVDGSSTQVRLPAGLEGFVLRPFSRIAAPFTSPLAMLLKKEFRLQQPCFVVAGVCCLVAVLGVFFHSITSLESNYHVGTVMMGSAFGTCFGLMPFLAGALSIGEERSWGMADWHLTLPPPAWKQWAAKMTGALGTSLMLGLVLPGVAFLIANNVYSKDPYLPAVIGLLFWITGYLLATSLVIYAASLVGDTLKAILLAFGLLAASVTAVYWLATALAVAFLHLTVIFGYGRLLVQILHTDELAPHLAGSAMFVLICLLQRFAFANYRQRHLGIRRAAIQLLVLMGIVVVLSALLISPNR